MDGNPTPKIIYEDGHLLVIDKPAGLTVNRADTTKDVKTVQDWIDEQYILQNQRQSPSDFSARSGIVHRIDKETSGLLLIAKTEESFINLQAQFKSGHIQKVYTALAHGKIKPDRGEIHVPVGRLPWNRKRFGVLPMGKEARTVYKVISYKELVTGKQHEELTLVELYPMTGRTHQIRVHLRYLGHPVFGDLLYAGRKNVKTDRQFLKRQFLHASKLSFAHPQSKELLSFESHLSPELIDFLARLE